MMDFPAVESSILLTYRSDVDMTVVYGCKTVKKQIEFMKAWNGYQKDDNINCIENDREMQRTRENDFNMQTFSHHDKRTYTWKSHQAQYWKDNRRITLSWAVVIYKRWIFNMPILEIWNMYFTRILLKMTDVIIHHMMHVYAVFHQSKPVLAKYIQ